MRFKDPRIGHYGKIKILGLALECGGPKPGGVVVMDGKKVDVPPNFFQNRVIPGIVVRSPAIQQPNGRDRYAGICRAHGLDDRRGEIGITLSGGMPALKWVTPYLVAHRPVFHVVGLRVAVGRSFSTPLRRHRAIGVFHPTRRHLGGARAEVSSDVRGGAYRPAELYKLVGSEIVRIHSVVVAVRLSERKYRLGRPAVARADPRSPVVVVGIATSGPANNGRGHLFYQLQDVPSHALNIVSRHERCRPNPVNSASLE